MGRKSLRQNHHLAPRQVVIRVSAQHRDDRGGQRGMHAAEVDLGAFVLLESGVLPSALTA
jgi:hypothetical protein